MYEEPSAGMDKNYTNFNNFFIVIIIIIMIISSSIGITINIIKYLLSVISHQELSCKGYWSAIRRKAELNWRSQRCFVEQILKLKWIAGKSLFF